MGCCCSNPERTKRMLLKTPGPYVLKGNNVYRVPPKGELIQVNKDSLWSADVLMAIDGYLFVADSYLRWLRCEDGKTWQLHEDEPPLEPMPPLCPACACKGPSLPSISMPSVSMPSISMPSMSMPSMSLPGWPKITINTDSWSAPSSSWSGVYWATVAADDYIAVACSSNLYLVDMETGKYKQLNNDSSWSVAGMGWSGKLGKLIIASSYTYAIYAMDIQTGSYEKISDDSWTDVEALAVRGDKAYIACRDGNLYKFDLDDREVKELEKAKGNFGDVTNLWFKGDKLHVLFKTSIAKVDESDGSTSKVCDVSGGADDAACT